MLTTYQDQTISTRMVKIVTDTEQLDPIQISKTRIPRDPPDPPTPTPREPTGNNSGGGGNGGNVQSYGHPHAARLGY
jgi:hypothetical protein